MRRRRPPPQQQRRLPELELGRALHGVSECLQLWRRTGRRWERAWIRGKMLRHRGRDWDRPEGRRRQSAAAAAAGGTAVAAVRAAVAPCAAKSQRVIALQQPC